MEVALDAKASLANRDDGPRLQMRFPTIASEGYANARSFAWQMRQPTWTLGVTYVSEKDGRLRLSGVGLMDARPVVPIEILIPIIDWTFPETKGWSFDPRTWPVTG